MTSSASAVCNCSAHFSERCERRQIWDAGNKTSVSLISCTLQNHTCMFLRSHSNLGRFHYRHSVTERCALDSIKEEQIFEINYADRLRLSQSELYKLMMEVYDETHIRSHSSKVTLTHTSRWLQRAHGKCRFGREL